MSANLEPSLECDHENARFPIGDRRVSPRLRTVYFTVKVDRGGSVGLFRARNISDTGIMLDTYAALDVDEPVLISISERFAISGTVQWRDEHRCGVRFERPIDSAALLHAEAKRKQKDRRRGSLRLTASRLATSFSEKGIRAVKLFDVSHRGMGVKHDGSLGAGMLFKLVLDSGIQRSAEVRWSEDGRAGIRLLEPLNCEELANVSGLDPLASVPPPAILRDRA